MLSREVRCHDVFRACDSLRQTRKRVFQCIYRKPLPKRDAQRQAPGGDYSEAGQQGIVRLQAARSDHSFLL